MSNETVAYLKDGSEVVFHQKVGDEYLVEEMRHYQEWDGDWVSEPSGEKKVVSEILKTPPMKKYSDDILELERRIQDKRSELYDVQNLVSVIKNEYSEIKKTIGDKVPALKYIDDFISGDYKYFAYLDGWSSRYEIKDKNEAIEENEFYERGTKLLTLYGKSNGDLHWELNKYRDGSGSSQTVIPCKTVDDAKKAICDSILSDMASQVKSERVSTCCGEKMISFLSSCNVEIDGDWLCMYEKEVKINNDKERERLTKEYKNIKERLEKLNA